MPSDIGCSIKQLNIDGGNFVVGGASGKIYIFNVTTYSLLSILNAYDTGEIVKLVMMSNGLIAGASLNYTVGIWNATQSQIVSSITSVTYSSIFCLGQYANGGNLIYGGNGTVFHEYNVTNLAAPVQVAAWYFFNGTQCQTMITTFSNLFVIATTSNQILLVNQSTTSAYMSLNVSNTAYSLEAIQSEY